MFTYRLNDFVNSSSKEVFINCYQNRNITSFQLFTIGRDRVIGHFELEKRIENIKGDIFDISFPD